MGELLPPVLLYFHAALPGQPALYCKLAGQLFDDEEYMLSLECTKFSEAYVSTFTLKQLEDGVRTQTGAGAPTSADFLQWVQEAFGHQLANVNVGESLEVTGLTRDHELAFSITVPPHGCGLVEARTPQARSWIQADMYDSLYTKTTAAAGQGNTERQHRNVRAVINFMRQMHDPSLDFATLLGLSIGEKETENTTAAAAALPAEQNSPVHELPEPVPEAQQQQPVKSRRPPIRPRGSVKRGKGTGIMRKG